MLVQAGWKPRGEIRSGWRLEDGDRALDRYIGTETCRAYELSQYLDDRGAACGPEALLCDNCYQAGVPCTLNVRTDVKDRGREEEDVHDLECWRDQSYVVHGFQQPISNVGDNHI